MDGFCSDRHCHESSRHCDASDADVGKGTQLKRRARSHSPAPLCGRKQHPTYWSNDGWLSESDEELVDLAKEEDHKMLMWRRLAFHETKKRDHFHTQGTERPYSHECYMLFPPGSEEAGISRKAKAFCEMHATHPKMEQAGVWSRTPSPQCTVEEYIDDGCYDVRGFLNRRVYEKKFFYSLASRIAEQNEKRQQ